jgi:hypothetical protein
VPGAPVPVLESLMSDTTLIRSQNTGDDPGKEPGISKGTAALCPTASFAPGCVNTEETDDDARDIAASPDRGEWRAGLACPPQPATPRTDTINTLHKPLPRRLITLFKECPKGG